MSRASDDAGMVLVAVVWLLALLGGLTTAIAIATSSAVSTIDGYKDPVAAAAAIDAGLEAAAARLLPADAAASGESTLTTKGGQVSFAWVAETARIDVNMAPKELLAGLFARLGAAPEAAAAYAGRIVGLRGPDAAGPPATPGRPPGYDPDEETPAAIKALARGGTPAPGEADPHKPLTDVVQLQHLPGLPPALMARAGRYLTTYSGVAGVDAMLAAPEIIEALPGMTRERVRTTLALRTRGADPNALADALGPAKAFTVDKPSATTRVSVRVVLTDGFTQTAEVVIVHFADDREAYRVLAWDDDVQQRVTRAGGEAP